MKQQTILFDLDGTLTDPKVGITKSVQYALAKFGIHETDLDKLVPFIGPPLVESFQEVYGLSQTEAADGVRYYREYFTQAGMFENAVYPGIREMLVLLCEEGKRLVIATSKPTVYSEQIVEHFGLAEFFQGIVGSNLDGSRIHKGEVIAYALSLLGNVPRQELIMVGDRKHDIIGARENGLEVIAVQYGYGSREELQAANPTYLAATVSELTDLLRN